MVSMNFTRRKVIAGVSFALMLGGTVLFAVVAIDKGLPKGREVWINLWPVITGIGTIVSYLALRKNDHQLPSPPGSWHLSLNDLLAASLTFGALLGIVRAACDDLDFVQATFISALITAEMIFGFLCASRAQIPRQRRALFGLTFALGATGLLILGGWASVAILLLILRRGQFELSELWPHQSSARLAFCAMLIGLPAARYCYRMFCESQTTSESDGELPGGTGTEELKRVDRSGVPVTRHE